MQILQSAATYEWSDDKVAGRLMDKLQAVCQAPATTTKAATQVRKVTWNEPVETLAGKTREPASGRSVKAEGSPARAQSAEARGKGNGQACAAKSPKDGNNPRTCGPAQFATRICPDEWTESPKVVSLSRLKQCLQDNETVPGNLIISNRADTCEDVAALIAAYEFQGPITLATPDPQNALAPAIAVWWSGSRDRRGPPERVRLKLQQMSEVHGPKLKPPTTVKTLPQKKVPLCTLRVLTPAGYRKFVLGPGKQDDPATIIGELAREAQCQASVLTGGHWQKVTHSAGGPCLIGHLRVSVELAEKFVRNSGKRAIHTLVFDKTKAQPPVVWIPRPEKADDEKYFRYVAAQSADKKCPIAFRQGGGRDLGLVGANQEDFPQPDSKAHWVLHEVPKSWAQDDVSEFLADQGWGGAQVLARKKGRSKGARPSWVVTATPPRGCSTRCVSGGGLGVLSSGLGLAGMRSGVWPRLHSCGLGKHPSVGCYFGSGGYGGVGRHFLSGYLCTVFGVRVAVLERGITFAGSVRTLSLDPVPRNPGIPFWPGLGGKFGPPLVRRRLCGGCTYKDLLCSTPSRLFLGS